jgi:hypothetical protein
MVRILIQQINDKIASLKLYYHSKIIQKFTAQPTLKLKMLPLESIFNNNVSDNNQSNAKRFV